MGRQQRLRRERPARERKRASAGALGGLRGIVLVTAFAVLGAGGLVWAQQQPAPSPSATPSGAATTTAGKTRGAASAPVVIEEWADFQCPACRMFTERVEPRVVSELVASGQARLVFRQYAFLGDESQWAAEASECAADLGRFWDLHDALYARQQGENTGAFTRANLKKIGRDLGLAASFDSCVDSGRMAGRVRTETRAGVDKGVAATPTLYVNGQKIEGVPAYETLRDLVVRLAQPR